MVSGGSSCNCCWARRSTRQALGFLLANVSRSSTVRAGLTRSMSTNPDVPQKETLSCLGAAGPDLPSL